MMNDDIEEWDMADPQAFNSAAPISAHGSSYAKGKGKAPATDAKDTSSEFGDDTMVMDMDFLEDLDKVEMDALGGSQSRAYSQDLPGPAPTSPQTAKTVRSSTAKPVSAGGRATLPIPQSRSGGPRSGSVSIQTPGRSQRPTAAPAPLEVITIEDDEDDKENMAVMTRRTRRRTEIGGDDGGRTRANQASASQASGRARSQAPVILATDPDDVINISDSD